MFLLPVSDTSSMLVSDNQYRTRPIVHQDQDKNIATIYNQCKDQIGGGCAKEIMVEVPLEQFIKYVVTNDVYVFPNLDASQREALFMSGLCSDCYDGLMGGM